MKKNNQSKIVIRRFIALLMLILFISLSNSCQTQPNTNEKSESIVLQDALGREVILPALPQRILLGGSGSLMITDAMYAFPEAHDRVVAYAKTDQGHGSFTELLDANQQAVVIDNRSSAEEIITYEPDLVLLKSYMKDVGDALETLGVPVMYVDFETLEQYQRDLTNIGIILDNTARAQELIAYYQSVVDGITQKTDPLTPDQKPSVLFIYYSSKDGEIAFNVPPVTWAQTIMVERAGGIPVWKEIEVQTGWTRVGFEQIAAWDPDLVFVTAYFDDVDTVKLQLLSNPQWKELRAVQTNRLFAFPMEFYSWDQPHTRWGLAQQWLATKIQPDLFSDFNLFESARDTYNFLYDFSGNEFDETIMPKFQGDVE